MKMHRLPTHYWPTTVVFIDDSKALVDALQMEYAFHNIPTLGFYSPTAALHFFREDPAALDRLASSFQFTENASLPEILRTIYHERRFTIPSVMVVDYGMPGMTGAELCQTLSSIPAKKLMLTGEATDHVGVTAFNQRIIDRFLSKGSASMSEELTKELTALMHAYFLEAVPSFVRSIYQDPLCPLGNLDYIHFVQDIFQKHGIVEYYLLEKSGSLLMLTLTGELYWLFVQAAEERTPEYRAHLPLPTTPIPNLPTHHYALVEKQDFGIIQRDRILSLETYLSLPQ